MKEKQFKVVAEGNEILEKTIQLLFLQSGGYLTARSWKFVPGTGLVYYWHENVTDASPFPVALDASGVYTIIKQWLAHPDSSSCVQKNSYRNGDGSYSIGWEITNHLPERQEFYQLLVVKPVELYHGK